MYAFKPFVGAGAHDGPAALIQLPMSTNTWGDVGAAPYKAIADHDRYYLGYFKSSGRSSSQAGEILSTKQIFLKYRKGSSFTPLS